MLPALHHVGSLENDICSIMYNLPNDQRCASRSIVLFFFFADFMIRWPSFFQILMCCVRRKYIISALDFLTFELIL